MKKTIAQLESYALHSIQNEKEIPFSSAEYSRFKFGSKSAARKFGTALANGFIKYLSQNPINSQIVVVSSPYDHIPTATFAMKDYFLQRLNEWLVENNMPVAQQSKIHRTRTYHEDYGNMTAAERLSMIENDSFYVDAEFLKGKTILLLDDIRITGGHEIVVSKAMNKYGVKERCIYLYFAQLTNPEVCPKIENKLNYAFVKRLDDLAQIILNENFIPNTRVVKFMLNRPLQEFQNFITYQSDKLRSTIYHLAIGNSYHLIPEYKNNLSYLKKIIPK